MMNHKLRNLDEKMNETILKDIRFEEKHKQHVLKAVKGSSFQEPKEKHFLQRKLNIFLSGSVTCALLFGIIIFAGDQMGFFQDNKSRFEESVTEGNSSIKNDYLAKYNLYNKMYNPWKYIDNLQGEYVWGNGRKNTFQRVRFDVDSEKERSLTVRETIKNGILIETTNILNKGNFSTVQLDDNNVFTKVDNPDEKRGLEYPEKVRYIRGIAWITNSEWYQLLTENNENWSFKEGESLGMPVYQIEGEIPEEHSKLLAGRFTMTVSKETGLLLDLKCYGQENKIIFYITVNEVQINKGIPDSVFKLDLSESKEVSWDEYMSQVRSTDIFKGEITGWNQARDYLE